MQKLRSPLADIKEENALGKLYFLMMKHKVSEISLYELRFIGF
jgi:hypothetical protein